MKLFSVLRKDLLILVRNRAEMAVLFLMPLAFILPISFALGAGDGYGINRSNQMIPLPVINYDGGPRAQELMAAVGESLLLEIDFSAGQLQALNLAEAPECSPVFGVTRQEETNPAAESPEPSLAPTTTAEEGAGAADISSSPVCTELAARALLQQSARTAALIIPDGFSEVIESGEPAQIGFIYDPAGDPIRLQQVEGVVRGAAIKVSLQNQVSRGFRQLSDLVLLAPASVREPWAAQNDQPQTLEQDLALNLKKVAPANYKPVSTPDTYQQTIPGYTVMFVFFIIAAMTASIREEKLTGTFRRLLSAPVSRAELAAGKLLSTMLVGFVQLIFLFIVGALVFQFGLGRDPLAFLVLSGALVTTAATLGLAAASFSIKGAGLAAPLVIAALLGGCMFPVDLMPPFLRSLSYAVPHSWAMNGYLNLMVRGVGLQEVMPQISALLGFSLLFFFIAIWRFRFED